MAEPIRLVPRGQQANKEAMRVLEIMMERVKSGEIQVVAVVGVSSDGEVTTAWSRCLNFSLLLGGVSYLMHRLHTAIDRE